MTIDEQSVWHYIANHRGRDNAIGARDLAQLTRIPERRVRSIVRSLRLNFHKPIGSTTHAPAGFYLCTSADELREWRERWRRHAVKELKMAYDTDKFNIDDLLSQIRLELEQETTL